MYRLPVVIDKEGDREVAYDLYSRLLKDRIIFLGTAVTSDVSNAIIAQLLFLESSDPTKDIYLYINSPGGEVVSGLGIYDTMQYVKPDIMTVCIGSASSMACQLLAAGTKGKRFALPHARIMMHPVSGGFHGQSPDAAIYYKEMVYAQEQMHKILALHTGRTETEIEEAFQRDKFMSPEEAIEFGLIDKVYEKSMRGSNE